MAETIASLAVRIGADLSGFEKQMKEFNKTWGKLGQQVQQAGQQIGTTFTAVGGAIAVGLGFAVKKGMEFDGQMSRVGAIAGATDSDFQALRKSALDLGASTSKSATEVAQGMELMAAKGYNAQQIIAAMPGVISAAEASGEDMALVADTVASALNGFGLAASDASRVADVLAMSANTSAAGIEDLQYAFKYAAPWAKQLGISIEELSAATGIMVNAGMKGEQAGTTLRMMFQRLVDPPKEARAVLERLGIQVTDSTGKFRSMGDIIGQFSKSLAGMTDAQKAAAVSQIFGAEASSGLLNVIAAGPEKFAELTKALEQSGGTSEKVAKLMKQNLKGTFEELGGAVETAQILFSDALAPAIKVVTEGLRDIVSWFNQLSPATQKFIAIGAAVTTALLLIAGAVGFLSVGLGFLATAQWAVILPWAGIIAAVTAGIVALIAIVAVIISYWDEIKAFLGATWNWIKETAASTWESIKQTTISTWESVKTFLVGLWDGIVQIAKTVWDGIVSFLKGVWDNITGIFQAVWNVIGPIVMTGWENINTIFTAAFTTVKAVVMAGWEILKTIFATAFLAIYYLVTGQWNQIGGLFQAAWLKLQGIVIALWEAIKSIWQASIAMVWARTQAMWNYVGELFTNAWNKLKQIITDMWENIKAIWSSAADTVIGNVSSMWTSVITFFAEAPGRIAAKLIELKNQVMAKWQEMKSDAMDMGKNIIQGMIDGIMSMARSLADRAKAVVQSAVNAAKSALGIHSPSKVFMEIGGYTAEGMAIGMEDGTGMIRNAASLMAESTISSAATGVAGSGGGGTTVVIELDGKVIAKKTFELMAGTLRMRGAVT